MSKLSPDLKELFPENVSFTSEAVDDFLELDGSQRLQVLTGIRKVAKNPRPNTEGGYGKPLENQSGSKLAGFNKVVFTRLGIRCVYRCIYDDPACGMRIIIISARAESKVYKEAAQRIEAGKT